MSNPKKKRVERLTKAEIAKHFEVTVQTVEGWMREGAPSKLERRDGRRKTTFDLAELSAWIDARPSKRTSREAGGENAASLAEIEIETAKAVLRVKRGQAESVEHANAVRRGEYLPASNVEAGRLARIAVTKSALLQMPGKMAGQLVGRDVREIERRLADEIERVLTEFAR